MARYSQHSFLILSLSKDVLESSHMGGQRPAGHTREGRASGRILRQAQDEDLKNG
jgi:hypothetical protein